MSTAAKHWSTSVATEPWYPIVADVLALHEALMRGLGENPAPLLPGGRQKLESAIAAPQWAGLYAQADLADQATLLAVRIAQAHALLDNNKRLAYIVSVIFLRENGHPLPAEHALTLAKQIESAVDRRTTIGDLAAWLRQTLT